MTAFVTACIWIVLAAIVSALPSRRNHWPAAYTLIALGLPILIWLWASNPWPLAALTTLAMASVLRWPLIYLGRSVKALVVER